MTSLLDRREFLKTSLAGLSMGSALLACQEDDPSSGIPRRPLGRTGEMVSIIGIGGWDVANVDDATSIALMHEAIDEGVNFFDNCWEYHEGHAEEVMGEALAESSRRDQVYLMTKVCARDYEGAKRHLEDSLRRLRTDRLDLWQFHGIKYDDDPELIFDPDNGAIRAALEARDEGKIRHIGFTGHEDPAHHLEMLDQDFEWDAIQMPLNVLDAHFRSFQHRVLPVTAEREIGVIGMKGLAAQDGRIPREVGISAEDARRYTLSLPISTLVCGIQSRDNLQQDIAIARNFAPFEESDVEQLLARSEEAAQGGEMERYKTGDYGCNWHHRQMG